MATILLPCFHYLKVWQRRHAELLDVRWRLLRSRLDGATSILVSECYVLYPAAHHADPQRPRRRAPPPHGTIRSNVPLPSARAPCGCSKFEIYGRSGDRVVRRDHDQLPVIIITQGARRKCSSSSCATSVLDADLGRMG